AVPPGGRCSTRPRTTAPLNRPSWVSSVSLSRQPGDRCMVNQECPGNLPAAFTSSQALEGRGLLMISKLWLAVEPRASDLGGCTAIIGSPEDPGPLILGHCR